jgi:hypothetical protein
MSAKQNCWEFSNCGREPDGAKVAELGICPAATDTYAHGLNGGENGGRICWAVAGTFVGKIPGRCVEEKVSCVTCDFFELVEKEEGVKFVLLKPGQIFYY